GLRFANNEVCYPATLVAGDFIRALESGRHRRDQVALAITQTGGQCRATAYAALIRRAVSAAGFADVPVVAIGTAAGAVRNAQPGFRLRWRGCRRLAVAALFYADSLASMYHAAAPRETAPAVAARVRDHYLAAGVARVRRRDAAALPGLLRAAAREFNAVTPPSAPRPRVGVVGEIYVKHNAAGNRHLVEWLIAQGVEPVVPPLADFFLQEFFNRRSNREQHLSRLTVNDLLDPALRKVLELYREKFTRAAAGFRYHQPPDNLADGHAAATRIVSPAAQYGEGWLIPAELSALAGRGINHAVSVQPFGCIANQLVAKGIERRLRDLHPRLNLLCLDFDPGASEANIFNRLHFLIHGAREDLGAVGLPGGGNSKCQTPNAN
ncbi:MAG: 2-hydroxyacyl-CoA dehydratase, partial [Verrucomicrobiales bacterium]|nr:2-hydroxyacyl-CoA dehydratase [Verrucomicrobiales bacterium]